MNEEIFTIGAGNDLKLSQAYRIVIPCTPCKVQCFTFALLPLRDVICDVTRVINFSSIIPDQIELANRESHRWTQKDLPNRMICNMTLLDKLSELRALT